MAELSLETVFLGFENDRKGGNSNAVSLPGEQTTANASDAAQNSMTPETSRSIWPL